VLKKLDSDGDGSISWPEFEAAVLEANPDDEDVSSALSGRAKALFDAIDTSGTGTVSKAELFAKLKADKQVESLLTMGDVGGKGFLAAMKMGTVLKKLDSDGDGSISWPEFEAAVLEANPDDKEVAGDGGEEEKPIVVITPAAVDSPILPLDPKKKALLFAMDYYQCAAGWKVINGTVGDATQYSNLLTNTWGVDPASQTIVSDRTKQTTAAMHQAFDNFTTGLEPGDIVALYYSGHGDRVFDADGDEVDAKGNSVTDAFDEGICTVDGHLIDDVIKEKLNAMFAKGVHHIFWFVDACYSGGFVEQGTPNCVVITSSTDSEKSEDALRMQTDEVTGKTKMFYQGTGTKWLMAAVSELYREGGSGAATTYRQLFEAIQVQRAKDTRTGVQNPTLVATEQMTGKAVLQPAPAPALEEEAAAAAADEETAPPAEKADDDDDDSDSGTDEEEQEQEEAAETEPAVLNPTWAYYRGTLCKDLASKVKGRKVRVYHKRALLKTINDLYKVKAKADQVDDREGKARATMAETVEQMMTQKYGTGVYKARKQLSFYKSLHAYAKGRPKESPLDEATLLAYCIPMAKPISAADVCKICDTYAANRKHITKTAIKEVFLKAHRVDAVLEALRLDDTRKEAEDAAGAALAQQEIEGEAHVPWAAVVLAAGVANA